MTTAVLESPMRAITPRIRKAPQRRNFRLSALRHTDGTFKLHIGARGGACEVRGDALKNFLNATLGGATAAKLLMLDRRPTPRERMGWRGGWTVLQAVGTADGVMVAVRGTPSALGYASVCRAWQRKLGLTEGKVRYLRVFPASA